MSIFLSFKLPDDFIAQYEDIEPSWGFDIGGDNSLSELVFITKYSRKKADGTKEKWYEVCRRCVEGSYTVLKNHCKTNRTPWNEFKAQAAAKDAFDRMFNFKWTPPGRGLQFMGTDLVHEEETSNPLYNCAFISTGKLSHHSAYEATHPFVRLMEMSINGVGVGFDTRGADKLTINNPEGEPDTWVIPDTREGWCESLERQLETFFFKNRRPVKFDYSEIRPAGAPIKRFGGQAPGPGPLKTLHENIQNLLGDREGETLSSTDIVDLMNMVGKSVVAGGLRRSALIALGEADDEEYLDLKDWEKNPERMGADGWGWTSNNSVIANVKGRYDESIAPRIGNNGEPGLIYLDLCQSHGRLADAPDNSDYRVLGVNPCAEITLESEELCNLVEIFPLYHDDIDDFKATLKHAYMYAKSVTLLTTSWPETNEVINRNRRLGLSLTGLAEFIETHDWIMLQEWMDEGYKYTKSVDKTYSEWLGVRNSIKLTTVKPSGTTSIIAGTTPGVHFPTDSNYYIRRVRYSVNDPLVEVVREAGYNVEPDVMDPENTLVAEFPTNGTPIRNEKEVSMWEKTQLAVLAQKWWADNAVSVTVTFQEHEVDQIGALIQSNTGHLKTISMLPVSTGSYDQMPYETIDEKTYAKLVKKVKPINMATVYEGSALDFEMEKFCTSDHCEI